MTGRFIVADVTSHRRGFGVQPIVDAAARHAQTSQHSHKVLWLVPSYLTTVFNIARGIGNTAEVRNCDTIGPPLWTLIQKEIETVSPTTSDIEIIVVTWDQFIYGQARDYGRGIVATKWFDWLEEGRASGFSRPQFAQPIRVPQVTAPMPSSEQLRDTALDYLKSIGAMSKDRALYRSQLRPALIRANPAFQPVASHPLFASAFKTALDNAIKSKVIGEDCPSPGKERIWVCESCAPPALAVTPHPDGDAQNDQRVVSAPTFERSAQFRKRLTDLGIFCEKRERDIFMEALGQLLKNGPLKVSRLRRELPKAAKQLAERREVCLTTEFGRIVNFFLKLLLVSGALTREDGTLIKRNASAEAAAVAGVQKDAADIVESYLLEQILKKSDVKDREHWQLALALFREFDQPAPMDDKLDRIATLIDRLSDRVILTNDGFYEYTESVSTGIRAIRAQV